MKKISTLIFILILTISVNSFAIPSSIVTKSNTEEGVQVSITLKDEKTANKFISALEKSLDANAVDNENKKEETSSFFSFERMKSIISSDTFHNMGSVLLRVLAIILVSIVIQKILKMSIKLTLKKVSDRKKISARRKQKINTILPLIYNTVDIIFFILVLLIVLSELGIDIAPLLAGAGVVGLAIGFGAQTLVKDFITGFFILLEGTVNIGDVITIGNFSGKVEGLSIKSVILRDLEGTVHTVPFSEVTTVSNKTKDFSYHVFNVGVAYRENTDLVTKEIQKISKKMCRDKELSNYLLDEECEILGVDALGDSAVVIKGRLKTIPGKQWSIGREFNRRIKLSFDELGIEIPFPHTTIYFGEDKTGNAPSANVRIEK